MSKSTHLANIITSFGLVFLLLPVLIIMALFMLFNLSAVIMPFFMFIKTILFKESMQIEYLSPLSLTLKIFLSFASLYFIFVLYSVISIIFAYSSCKIEANNILPYEYNLIDLIFRGLSWNFRRMLFIITPPAIVIAIALTLFLIITSFFNIFLVFAGINLGFIVFTGVFTFLSLLFAFIFSLIISFQRTITTALGMQIAVSEPDLPNDKIQKRSLKMSCARFKNTGLIGLYILFNLILIIQFIDIIFLKNINSLVIIIISLFDVVLFAGLSYLKTIFYFDSMFYQFYRILNLSD